MKRLLKYWWVFLLIIIFVFSYYIRSINIVPDRLLSFDPIFQYRFTKYVADFGTIPAWDELSYYIGRADTPKNSLLFWYLTAAMYWAFKAFGYSLMTVASYASAFWGALIVIPAFLLGRKLSNNYGGLMAGVLAGTAPQILIRTFGSSYDSDQLVVFFILLTTYLCVRLVKERSLANFSLALLGLTAFTVEWGMSVFVLFIMAGFVIMSILVSILSSIIKNQHDKSGVTLDVKDYLKGFGIILALFVSLIAIGYGLGLDPLSSSLDVIGFAQKAEVWIVNISIAELQPFDVFSISGWVTAMGNFTTGISIMDVILFIAFIASIIFGLYWSYKNNTGNFPFILTLLIVGLYTTSKGIRFTEFSSTFNVILIAVGMGYLIEFLSKRNLLLKTCAIGMAISIALIAMNLGQMIGQSLGPDINSNWDDAWAFLRTKTPELSLVGTWWDPGHMITGLAERRVIADGAHCPDNCKYTINDRITDLGLIMATSDENVSMGLIRKYQGDSPKVYWIASNDLIGKYQWLQYFGTDCDARYDSNCPLYVQLSESNRYYDNNGNTVFNVYSLGAQSNVMVYNVEMPIPIYVEGINAALFNEIIFYNGTIPVTIAFTEEERNAIITSLQPLERQLNIRFTNDTIPMTVWMPANPSYMVIIPSSLRNTVFTRMFMLEGQGLEHFRQVFRNDEVKIYEVIP
jgi:dolichyl-diphosphooligosaccharide--protein glycosyltransferase